MEKLPPPFADLEQSFGRWVIDNEPERARMREAASADELRAFYEAVLPRVDEMMRYIEDYAIDQWPQEIRSLWDFVASFIGAAVTIETYGSQKQIPGGFYLGRVRTD